MMKVKDTYGTQPTHVGEGEEEVGSIQMSRSDVEKTVEVHSGNGSTEAYAAIDTQSQSFYC